ncbi:MAG: bZIP transcription factor [Planctomycetota bacterium]
MATALAAALVSGCAGSRRVAQENNRLRELRIELEKENARLEGRIAELEAELRTAAPGSPSVSTEILANTPHVVGINVGWLSHARDTDGDGRPDTLVVYVKPTDGLGRFVQMVGHLDVHAAVLTADAGVITLGATSLDPGELRRAYRPSLLGASYTVTVPIAVADTLAERECTVHVAYTDGHTSRRQSVSRSIDLWPPRPPSKESVR